jgi:hypothetical protein
MQNIFEPELCHRKKGKEDKECKWQKGSTRKNCVFSIMVKIRSLFFFLSVMHDEIKPVILHGISAVLSWPMLSCICSELV